MARGPALRPLRPPVPAQPQPRAVEALADRIGELVAERQELRSAAAPRPRSSGTASRSPRAQWELAHALIDRYLPAEPARTAA